MPDPLSLNPYDAMASIRAATSMVPWERVDVAYPSATVETYTYVLNSVTVMVITVTYTSSAKTDISSVVKTAS